MASSVMDMSHMEGLAFRPSSFDAARLVDYVLDLPLKRVDPTMASFLSLGTEPAKAKIDAGSLVSFVAGVSSDHQADVLNSVLLAQLAANKVADREDDTEAWYKKYVEVLGKVGWVIQQFGFESYSGRGSNFTMSSVVTELLGAIATANELDVVNRTLQAFRSLAANDRRVVLFTSSSSKYAKGNFQIIPVTEQGDLVTMKLGAFHFSADSSHTNFLFFSWGGSSVSFYHGVQAVTLNNSVYARVRDAVVAKLGDNAVSFVKDLDI